MMFRSLDLDGDWVFGSGRQAYAQAQAAIALSLQTRLNSFANDCFFDPLGWIDWFNLLGSKNQTALAFSIRSIIEDTPGVSSIVSSDVRLDSNRRMTCTYTVTTVYGASITASIVFPVTPFAGISKYVGDIVFDGVVTFVDVTTSVYIRDARAAIWSVYDESDGYSPVVGAVSVIDAETVRVTISPAPAAGSFRLVGIS